MDASTAAMFILGAAGSVLSVAGVYKMARAASLVQPKPVPFGMLYALNGAVPGSVVNRSWWASKILLSAGLLCMFGFFVIVRLAA